MKQGTVKFSKEFITPIGLHEWITLEWPVDEPFDEKRAKETFVKVRDFVCNYQTNGLLIESDNAITPPPVINVERTSEDVRVAKLIKDIYACTELEGENGLWSYNKLASTNEEAKLAYEIMGKRLRKKESRDLLDATNEFYDKRRPKQSGNS